MGNMKYMGTAGSVLKGPKKDKKVHTCGKCKWWAPTAGGWCTNIGHAKAWDKKSHCGRYNPGGKHRQADPTGKKPSEIDPKTGRKRAMCSPV